MQSSRTLCRWTALATLVVATAVSAQGYPDKSRPIKIIVPTGAASTVDLLARAQAQAMTEVGGVSTVVDNKPGAEFVIGINTFTQSPPDGYTLMITSSSSQSLNPVMIPNLPYDPVKDFIPVATISKTALAMNLGPSTTFKSAREFIAAARANPGKYTCGSSSTTTRMACELLQATAGIKLLNVPYKATAGGLTALAGGEVDLYFVDMITAQPHWQSGRVRGVAVTGATRMGVLPQMPTLKEEGVPDYDLTAWYAAYLPLKTPPEVVNAARELFRRATKARSLTDTLTKVGMDPLDLAGEQVNELTRREIDMWSKVVKSQNIAIGK